ncbi:J domain-containing protein [Arthrobacter echini]|uniref:J domain-containing protein n=1 Tax=Arthrobacter echini TaxID=1529066 RepID=A0A4S5E3G2_9MICC|nr:J domain-containing protein [Arthrobacter echini]THJ65991.1 J domain-containing protein [Arthrobacter echini]
MADAPRRSYYDILGVSPSADARTIKSAYRRAARAAHPDLGGNATAFHDVAVAYETLGDPQLRERYDAEAGRPSGARPSGADATTSSSGPRASRPPGSGARRTPGARRTGSDEEDASSAPASYLPPFSPTNPPEVPLILAGRQLHGSVRQPGVLARLSSGARSRADGEARTTALLERALLPGYPAARLITGVEFDDRDKTAAGHLLLAGYRLAVIDSFTAAPGNFSWDGRVLRHQGRAVDLRLPETVRVVQDLFPDLNVAGWVVVHGAPDNPFAPVIDVPPGFDRSPAAVQVVNAGTAVRTIRAFLAAGPSPNAVQLPVLARLLALTES